MSRVAPGADNRLSIDLDALSHNYKALSALLSPGFSVAGVVKADAYGHGLLPVARRLKEEGCPALAVVVLSEAVHLRKEGIVGPILVLSGVIPEQAKEAVVHDTTPLLFRKGDFEALSGAAQTLGKPARCHLKVDTGMSRLGARAEDALEVLEFAAGLPGLTVTGLDSHLATAGDPDSDQAASQARIYSDLLGQARAKGHELPESSLAASGGALVPPPGSAGPPGWVRLGIALYGGLPSPECAGQADLKGVMRYVTRMHTVRTIPAGTKVSYGATWEAPRETVLGVLPVGYSDGYHRALSNHGQVLVGGHRAPIRGRVCMNLTMVDLTGFDPLPESGAEVVLLGRQGGDEITADELGDWAGTICYEIYCSLGAANRRSYPAA